MKNLLIMKTLNTGFFIFIEKKIMAITDFSFRNAVVSYSMAILTAILISSLSGFTQIINVPTDQPFIQKAIDTASTGDTILVQPGTYIENLNFKGKNIVLGSLMLITGDTSYISRTVIDGNRNGSVVVFEGQENVNAELNGFTLTNGSGTNYWNDPLSQMRGGGIYCQNNSSPTLKNLHITGNIAHSANGAGICCWGSSPVIDHVRITENDGRGAAPTNDGSGGIYLQNSSSVLKNVEITNNKGVISGGLCIWGNCDVVLTNLTIANNEAIGNEWTDLVAEVVHQGSNAVFINSLIWNDHLLAIINRSDFGPSIITILHSDINGGEDSIAGNGETDWLNGNINEDPVFCNAEAKDYRFKAESPCIDAGIQDTYCLSNDGIQTIYVPPMSFAGRAPDIGAYEFDTFLSDVDNENTKYKEIMARFYPNPSDDIINIEVEDINNTTLEIFNVSGRLIFSKGLDSKVERIDISDYAKGLYLLKVRQADAVYVGKVVVK